MQVNHLDAIAACIAAFADKERVERWLTLLRSHGPKQLGKLSRSLYHEFQEGLHADYLIHLDPRDGLAGQVAANLIHLSGIDGCVRCVARGSSPPQIGEATISGSADLFESGPPVLLSVIPGKLMYFQGEYQADRFVCVGAEVVMAARRISWPSRGSS